MSETNGAGSEEKAPDSTNPDSDAFTKDGSMTGSEIQVQMVPFHEDQIEAIQTPDGEVYAVPKRICENIGLRWWPQFRKLQSDPHWGVTILVTPSKGGPQETCVIPLKKVAHWISTVQANKVAPEVREKIAIYREECADVLDRHFRKDPVRDAYQDTGYLRPIIEMMARAIEANTKAITLYSTDVARLNERVTNLEGKETGQPAEEEHLTVFTFCERNGIRTTSEINRGHTRRLKNIIERDSLNIVPKLIKIKESGWTLYHWPVSFLERYFSHEANRAYGQSKRRTILFSRPVDTNKTNR